MAISEAFKIHSSAKITEADLNGRKAKLKTKMETIFGIADSGSPTYFQNKKWPNAYKKMTIHYYSQISHWQMQHEIWYATAAVSLFQKQD